MITMPPLLSEGVIVRVLLLAMFFNASMYLLGRDVSVSGVWVVVAMMP